MMRFKHACCIHVRRYSRLIESRVEIDSARLQFSNVRKMRILRRERETTRENSFSRKTREKMKKVIHLVVGVIFIIPDLITFQSMMKWDEMRRAKEKNVQKIWNQIKSLHFVMLSLWRASFKRMMRERMPGQSRNLQRKSFFFVYIFSVSGDWRRWKQ